MTKEFQASLLQLQDHLLDEIEAEYGHNVSCIAYVVLQQAYNRAIDHQASIGEMINGLRCASLVLRQLDEFANQSPEMLMAVSASEKIQ